MKQRQRIVPIIGRKAYFWEQVREIEAIQAEAREIQAEARKIRDDFSTIAETGTAEITAITGALVDAGEKLIEQRPDKYDLFAGLQSEMRLRDFQRRRFINQLERPIAHRRYRRKLTAFFLSTAMSRKD